MPLNKKIPEKGEFVTFKTWELKKYGLLKPKHVCSLKESIRV